MAGLQICTQATSFPPAPVSDPPKNLQGPEASGHLLPVSSERKTQKLFSLRRRRATRKRSAKGSPGTQQGKKNGVRVEKFTYDS